MHPGGRPAKHPRSNFGARLKEIRERANISQLELAQKLEVSQQAVALWERRANTVRSDTLTKLAQALSVSVDDLLGEPKARRSSPPGGRLGQVFDAVSRLPRRQQQKIIEMAEGFLALHQQSKSS